MEDIELLPVELETAESDDVIEPAMLSDTKLDTLVATAVVDSCTLEIDTLEPELGDPGPRAVLAVDPKSEDPEVVVELLIDIVLTSELELNAVLEVYVLELDPSSDSLEVKLLELVMPLVDISLLAVVVVADPPFPDVTLKLDEPDVVKVVITLESLMMD